MNTYPFHLTQESSAWDLEFTMCYQELCVIIIMFVNELPQYLYLFQTYLNVSHLLTSDYKVFILLCHLSPNFTHHAYQTILVDCSINALPKNLIGTVIS